MGTHDMTGDINGQLRYPLERVAHLCILSRTASHYIAQVDCPPPATFYSSSGALTLTLLVVLLLLLAAAAAAALHKRLTTLHPSNAEVVELEPPLSVTLVQGGHREALHHKNSSIE